MKTLLELPDDHISGPCQIRILDKKFTKFLIFARFLAKDKRSPIVLRVSRASTIPKDVFLLPALRNSEIWRRESRKSEPNDVKTLLERPDGHISGQAQIRILTEISLIF